MILEQQLLEETVKFYQTKQDLFHNGIVMNMHHYEQMNSILKICRKLLKLL